MILNARNDQKRAGARAERAVRAGARGVRAGARAERTVRAGARGVRGVRAGARAAGAVRGAGAEGREREQKIQSHLTRISGIFHRSIFIIALLCVAHLEQYQESSSSSVSSWV